MEGGDHPFETPPDKANSSNSELLLAHPDAFAAEDTLVWVISEERDAFIYGEASFEFSVSLCLQFDIQMLGNFLKLTETVF